MVKRRGVRETVIRGGNEAPKERGEEVLRKRRRRNRRRRWDRTSGRGKKRRSSEVMEILCGGLVS